MKKKLLTVIILIAQLFFVNSINSQENYSPMLPSPTAAELGKYGSWPVDYYHGLPQISIPIYTISVAELVLPVSLSYHASGIKVDQEASWVGLGWSLNAGGVITRQINGSDDFDSFIEAKTFDEMANGDYPDRLSLIRNNRNEEDSEPDIYNYNFAGYSGRFIIKVKNGNPGIIFLDNNDGLKVHELVTNNDGTDNCLGNKCPIATFTLIDKNGVKYFFEDFESSFLRYGYADIVRNSSTGSGEQFNSNPFAWDTDGSES